MLECGFYNMDCLQGVKDIDSESIDLIVTDPPYPTTARGQSGSSGGMFQKEINKKGKVFTFNDIDCKEYAPEFYRILKNGSHCYVMTNHINLIKMLNTFTECGFHFVKSLIWDKGNKIMGQYYMSQFEYILFFRKGEGKPINNCGTSDILRIYNKKTKDFKGQNLHDTEKPISLYELLIQNSSNENDIVLDPFVGSGSFLVACHNTKRNCIGFELDKEYYDKAKQRLDEEMAQLRIFDFIQ